jgi:formiminoglutamase
MELKIFFTGIDESVYADIIPHNALVKSMAIHGETFPAYEGADIAIIGLSENRGAPENNSGVSKAANEIRRKLYRLKKGQASSTKVVDLGNLSCGMSQEETNLRIKEVCQMLIEQNILPLLIGGSHDLAYGQYLAYEDLEKLVSVVSIDAFLDMEDEKSLPENQRHIHKMLVHEPNYLFNFNLLGYQSYLTDPGAMAVLERFYFEAQRLGQLREDIKEVEPLIRDADLLSFDISAIKSSDAPGNAQAQPFGLTGEEACQLCWYAGLSEKLSSIGFFEYNPELDDERRTTAAVMATMIWYFIEGYYNRKNEQSFASNDYKRYIVSMPSQPSTITFYKSKLSEKWWMEVPHPQEKENMLGRNFMVSCSYSDYLKAVEGELPERWISVYAKLI